MAEVARVRSFALAPWGSSSLARAHPPLASGKVHLHLGSLTEHRAAFIRGVLPAALPSGTALWPGLQHVNTSPSPQTRQLPRQRTASCAQRGFIYTSTLGAWTVSRTPADRTQRSLSPALLIPTLKPKPQPLTQSFTSTTAASAAVVRAVPALWFARGQGARSPPLRSS